MNTKRKIYGAVCAAALAAALAFGSVMLTACGAEDTFVAPEYEYYTTAAEVSSLAGVDVTEYGNSAAVVSEVIGGETQYALYSFATDSVVAAFDTGRITKSGSEELYYRTNDGGSLSVYSAFGYVCDAASTSDIQRVVNGEIMRVSCGNGDYKYVDLKTGDVTNVTQGLKSLAYVSNGYDEYATDDCIVMSNAPTSLSIYDRETFELEKEIDLSVAINVPESVYDATEMILENGDYLLQYIVEMPSASDYDYAKGNAYYDIRTFIIDIPSGKVREKDVDFLIMNIANEYAYGNYSDIYACDNIAALYYIEDGYLSDTPDFVALSNSLSVGRNLTEEYGMDSISWDYLGDGKFWDYENNSISDDGGNTLAYGVQMIGTRFFGKQFGSDTYIYDVRTMERISVDTAYMTDIHAYGDLLLVEEERDGKAGYAVYNARTGEMSAFTEGDVTTDSADYTDNFSLYGVFTVASGGKYSLMSADPGSGTGVKAVVSDADRAFTVNAFSWSDERGRTQSCLLAETERGGETVCYRLTAQ